MIRYLKKYTQQEFDQEFDIYRTLINEDNVECECCLDFGYLEVSTGVHTTEIQACEECNYIHHNEER